MTEVSRIISDITHRPFDLPAGRWRYYQEWNKVLFLHWAIPLDVLRKFVPEQFHIDSFDGRYYISLVAFTMQKIRPKYLPAVKFISDFHEINLRTYIDNGNKKGVFFLNIEAEKHLSAYVARMLSGLPYEKAIIKRSAQTYDSRNGTKDFVLNTRFDVKEIILHKTNLDKWLTERYCLYFDVNEKMFRYDIHHQEWELKNVAMSYLQTDYKIGELSLSGTQPDLVHFSEGVRVVAWRRHKV